jgi:hypothetical protein
MSLPGIQIGPGINIGGGISFGTVAVGGLVTAGLILNLDAGNAASYSGTGTTWYDISGAGNDTTLSGSTPWTSAGAQSYFTFDSGIASGGYIVPNTTYTKLGVFRYAGGYYGNFISGGGNSAHAFWGGFTPYLSSGHNGAWTTVVSPVITPANQWVFGAVTFSNVTGWSLYLNNETPVTSPSTDQFPDDPAFFEIGGFDGNANNLYGDVATALIYNRALSDAEIAQNYNYFKTRFSIA